MLKELKVETIKKYFFLKKETFKVEVYNSCKEKRTWGAQQIWNGKRNNQWALKVDQQNLSNLKQ